MKEKTFFGSVARIADFDTAPFEVEAMPKRLWETGDYVVLLRDHIKCTILCASDPYAVVGVIQGYGIQPDVVAGIATSTSAGVELVEKLTGMTGLNLMDRSARPVLVEILKSKLDLDL